MTTIHKFPRPAANPASSPTEGADGAEGYSRSSAPQYTTGSIFDYDRLVKAWIDYDEAERAIDKFDRLPALKTAASRCGWSGIGPVTEFARRRVATYAEMVGTVVHLRGVIASAERMEAR